ncbi:MAG TPA: DUF4112 domain-containing protein [Thermoanaerobaculia bacterium]|nr:DUF4112 domain-containing protein [Thermoanaerobaculia bacterium]
MNPPSPVPPRKVLEPEVLSRDAPATPSGRPFGPPSPQAWIEKLAWVMDNSIPIGRWRVGLDGIIGLVPGLGDLVGALISAVIVAAGIQARLPRSAIARMVANVAIEAVVGLVPFLGDLFDVAWKANTKNVEIFREALKGERDRRKDSLFVAGVILAIGAIVAVPIIVIVLLARGLTR